MTNHDRVSDHYHHADLGSAILSALKAAGRDINALKPDDLTLVDEFHTRGRAGTVELADLAALTGAAHVLDVGCGIGGPSRYLASIFRCRVTGLDLTWEFCRVAGMLARRTGLDGRITYLRGNALALPFADQTFDVVWSQNSVMNIADRNRLYAEIRRVLKPGGRYVFSDVVAGPNQPLHFPVPWARDPSISFLLTAQGTSQCLASAGMRTLVLEDRTGDALASAQARTTAPAPLLGVHILLGEDFPAMAKNMFRNFAEERIGLVQGVAASK